MGGNRVFNSLNGNRRGGHSGRPAGRPRHRGGHETRGGGHAHEKRGGGHETTRGSGRGSRRAGIPGVTSATTKLSLRRVRGRWPGTALNVVGRSNGTFLLIGWHTTGQMAAFAPPTKLLERPVVQRRRALVERRGQVHHRPGFRTAVVPGDRRAAAHADRVRADGQPTVLFGLTLTPVSGKATTASVAAGYAHSQVSAAYPWGSTKPTFDSFNHQNTVSARGGVIQFRQESRPVRREVGASPQPATVRTGTGFWGPTPASQQTVFGTKGRAGSPDLEPVHSRGWVVRWWLGVAGSHTGAPPAVSALKAGLANPLALLAGKVAARDATAALTNVKVPDASVQRTILWSKLNLADLRRTITQAAIRDTKAGTAYLKPLATLRRNCPASTRPTPTTPSFRHGRRLRDLQPGGRGPVADRHAAPQHAAYRVADREREAPGRSSTRSPPPGRCTTATAPTW